MLVPAMALSAANAHPLATTRLVACDAGSRSGDCVLVRGHRASPQAVVEINARPVETSGGSYWRVRVPVATVRDWSAPFARTLRMTVTEPTGSIERDEAVRLPIGLLGQKVELAALTVHAR